MKTLSTALVLFFLLSCNQATPPVSIKKTDTPTVSTTTPAETPATEPADPIVLIRQEVERINTMKLEKKHFEFICDEKMMVDYFYADGEIVRIAVDFGTVGDVYAKEGYYYDSGRLIFNYEFVEGGPACEGCIKTDEYRSYILDNRVIKYLKNQTVANCRKCEFSPSSRQYKLLQAKTEAEMKRILCGL